MSGLYFVRNAGVGCVSSELRYVSTYRLPNGGTEEHTHTDKYERTFGANACQHTICMSHDQRICLRVRVTKMLNTIIMCRSASYTQLAGALRTFPPNRILNSVKINAIMPIDQVNTMPCL